MNVKIIKLRNPCNDCLNKLHTYIENREYVELVESSNKHQRTNGFLTYSTLYDENIIKYCYSF